MKWAVLLLLSFLLLVEGAHLHAHYTMDLDVDSYVRKFLKKNRDFKIDY
jgi:hypothetical protein